MKNSIKNTWHHAAIYAVLLFILGTMGTAQAGLRRRPGDELRSLIAVVDELKKQNKVKGATPLTADDKAKLTAAFKAAYGDEGSKLGQRKSGAEKTLAERRLAQLGYTPADLGGAAAAGVSAAEKELKDVLNSEREEYFKDLGEMSEGLGESPEIEVKGLAALPFPKDATDVDAAVELVRAAKKTYHILYQKTRNAHLASIKQPELVANFNIVDSWVEKLKKNGDLRRVFANQLAELEAYQKVARDIIKLLAARDQLRRGAPIVTVDADVPMAIADPHKLNSEIRSYVNTLKVIGNLITAKTDFDTIQKASAFKTLSKDDQQWINQKAGGKPGRSAPTGPTTKDGFEAAIKDGIKNAKNLRSLSEIAAWLESANFILDQYENNLTDPDAKLVNEFSDVIVSVKEQARKAISTVESKLQQAIATKQVTAALLEEAGEALDSLDESSETYKRLGRLVGQGAPLVPNYFGSDSTSRPRRGSVGAEPTGGPFVVPKRKPSVSGGGAGAGSGGGADVKGVAAKVGAFKALNTERAKARLQELAKQVAGGTYTEGTEKEVTDVAQAILAEADKRSDKVALEAAIKDLRDNLS